MAPAQSGGLSDWIAHASSRSDLSVPQRGLIDGYVKADSGPGKQKIGSPKRSPPIFSLPGALDAARPPRFPRLCSTSRQAAMVAVRKLETKENYHEQQQF